jgi:nitrate/TMAO reductase-like tetraheme cytochrome c subunit
MAFTVWYGYFMYPLVLGFEGKEKAESSLKEMGHAGTEQERLFVNLIATKHKTDTTNLGYRVIEQPYIEGRFHHIGFEIQQDKTSSCIRCHGNTPHDKSKEVRSFLNMHAFYTACETCHIRPEGDQPKWTFRWYDKETGKVTVNPKALVEIEHEYSHFNPSNYPTYGNYGAKIAPGKLSNGAFTFLKNENDVAFVERYLKEDIKLSEQQKSQIKRVIHKEINKKPIECNSCHQEQSPYIPFAELGYPPRRTAELTNTSVVGMIDKYKEFYIPSFLTTGD